MASPLAASVSKKELPAETLEMFTQLENIRDSSKKKKKLLAYTREFCLDWVQDKHTKLVPSHLKMEMGKILPSFQ